MEVNKHAKTLKRDGVVAIEDYFEESTCDSLYGRISSAIDQEDIDVVDSAEHNYEYDELSNWEGAVANNRRGKDNGMIDVFNIDQRVPEIASFKADEEIRSTIDAAAAKSFAPTNVNVYWNRSVTGTRGFHADTYSGKFKSFVYLTDVPDKSYGPFSYVRGSHDNSYLKNISSQLINKLQGNNTTDAVFYDEEDVEYFTAPKGTLIIANQAGYHRGYPQEEGKERMLVTTAYGPDEQ